LSYYSGELTFPPSSLSFTVIDSTTGWLSALAWLVGAASSIFLPGDIIPAVAALAHPSYHPEPWHSYLVILGVASLAYIINVYLVKYLPLLEGFIAAYMIIVFFSVVITLLVLSPKNSAEVVFQSFEPIVGGSNGVMAVLSSQVLLFFSLLGSDSVVRFHSEACKIPIH
jgi:choline transport protein